MVLELFQHNAGFPKVWELPSDGGGGSFEHFGHRGVGLGTDGSECPKCPRSVQEALEAMGRSAQSAQAFSTDGGVSKAMGGFPKVWELFGSSQKKLPKRWGGSQNDGGVPKKLGSFLEAPKKASKAMGGFPKRWGVPKVPKKLLGTLGT